jgi:hypothetical protein
MLRLPPGGAAARRAAAKLEGPAQIRRGRQLLQDEPVLHVLRVMPIELDGRKPICELGDFCVSIGETPHCRPGKHEQKRDEGSYERPEQRDSEGLQDSKLVVRRGRRESDDPARDCTDNGSEKQDDEAAD